MGFVLRISTALWPARMAFAELPAQVLKAADGRLDLSGIWRGVVEDGEIYKPEALAGRKENRTNRWESDPEVKCYMPGIPGGTYLPYPFQDRVIEMGELKEPSTDTSMGTGNGRWEGDTLVVDNKGFNDLIYIRCTAMWNPMPRCPSSSASNLPKSAENTLCVSKPRSWSS